MKLFAPHCSEINLNKISLEWFFLPCVCWIFYKENKKHFNDSLFINRDAV